ncbi:hypothetical protein PCE1_002268 [Barthelona sp. PCE]
MNSPMNPESDSAHELRNNIRKLDAEDVDWWVKLDTLRKIGDYASHTALQKYLLFHLGDITPILCGLLRGKRSSLLQASLLAIGNFGNHLKGYMSEYLMEYARAIVEVLGTANARTAARTTLEQLMAVCEPDSEVLNFLARQLQSPTEILRGDVAQILRNCLNSIDIIQLETEVLIILDQNPNLVEANELLHDIKRKEEEKNRRSPLKTTARSRLSTQSPTQTPNKTKEILNLKTPSSRSTPLPRTTSILEEEVISPLVSLSKSHTVSAKAKTLATPPIELQEAQPGAVDEDLSPPHERSHLKLTSFETGEELEGVESFENEKPIKTEKRLSFSPSTDILASATSINRTSSIATSDYVDGLSVAVAYGSDGSRSPTLSVGEATIYEDEIPQKSVDEHIIELNERVEALQQELIEKSRDNEKLEKEVHRQKDVLQQLHRGVQEYEGLVLELESSHDRKVHNTKKKIRDEVKREYEQKLDESSKLLEDTELAYKKIRLRYDETKEMLQSEQTKNVKVLKDLEQAKDLFRSFQVKYDELKARAEEKMSDLKGRNNILTVNCQEFSRRNKEVEEQLQTMVSNTEKLAQLQEALEVSQTETRNFRAQLTKEQKEGNSLRSNLDIALKERDSYEQEANSLKDELVALKYELKHPEDGNVQAQLILLREENAKLREQASAVSKMDVNEVRDLRRTIQLKDMRITRLQNDLDDSLQMCEEFAEQLKIMKNE